MRRPSLWIAAFLICCSVSAAATLHVQVVPTSCTEVGANGGIVTYQVEVTVTDGSGPASDGLAQIVFDLNGAGLTFVPVDFKVWFDDGPPPWAPTRPSPRYMVNEGGTVDATTSVFPVFPSDGTVNPGQLYHVTLLQQALSGVYQITVGIGMTANGPPSQSGPTVLATGYIIVPPAGSLPTQYTVSVVTAASNLYVVDPQNQLPQNRTFFPQTTTGAGFVINQVQDPHQGDVDDDGDVDLDDLPLFVDVLLGFDANPLHVIAADVNCDGAADGEDIQPFVELLLL